jgi:sterol desaturase/sphingolipid hydroxylase (fatty acid hydroxylase superfamily)
MILQWLQDLGAWFKTGEGIWFVSFWGLLILLSGLEVLIPAFEQPAARHDRWPTNFALGLVNMTLAPLAPVSEVWGAEWAHSQGVGVLNQFSGAFWIAVVATLAMRSLAGYTIHVLMHKMPLLWRMHRVHHFDTHLDASTSLRSHPAEFVAMLIILVPVAIAFGLTTWALIAYEIMDGLLGVFSHANLRLPQTVDRSVRWLFVTPNMHSLHHSSFRLETDSNYGSVFTLWDRLFGTYRQGPIAGYEAFQIGLKEIRDERAWNLWWQIKSPALRICPMSASHGWEVNAHPPSAERSTGSTLPVRCWTARARRSTHSKISRLT